VSISTRRDDMQIAGCFTAVFLAVRNEGKLVGPSKHLLGLRNKENIHLLTTQVHPGDSCFALLSRLLYLRLYFCLKKIRL
jgi:hypothetical protein